MEITQKIINRFFRKVDKEKSIIFYNGSRCWEWIGAASSGGYGSFRVKLEIKTAHRISWIIANKEIKDDLFVLHHCDNRLCVNPDHLFLGTNLDNMIDMYNKGRGDKSSGENHGMAKLTWHQVREIRRRYKWMGIGGETSTALAKEFNISKKMILLILHNQNWTE